MIIERRNVSGPVLRLRGGQQLGARAGWLLIDTHTLTLRRAVGRIREDGAMAKKIDISDGRAALDAVRTATAAGEKPARTALATAVRYLLQLLDEKAPGNSVEVRVPPFGAVQVVQGPRHTRGTPPNVIEMDAATWIALATGSETWAEVAAAGRVHASGTRADLTGLMPLRP